MKKLVDFLEANVQWVVLGLGGLFVLYAAWAYLIVPPVTVSDIAPDPLPPGQVDTYIMDRVGQELERKIQPGRTPVVSAPNPLTEWIEAMNYKGQAAEPMVVAHNRPPANPPKFDTAATPGAQPGQVVPEGGVAVNNSAVVQELPKLPAPTLVATRSGMSLVNPPQLPNQPAPVGLPYDLSWVSVRLEITMQDIANAFTAANIPQHQNISTGFLRVVLERQERQPDGNWGQPVEVKPPATIEAIPFPQNASDAGPLWQYIQWADQNQPSILQPPFYVVVKGDTWNIPGEVDPQLAQQTFDPNAYIGAPHEVLMQLTREQRLEVSRAAQERRREELRGRQPSPRAPAGRRPRGGDSFMEDQAQIDRTRPGGAAPWWPAGGGDEAYMEEGYNPGFAQPAAGNFPIPQGQFDPRTWSSQNPATPTIVAWAHDDSITPGKTYRYRVKYILKNPVFVRNDLVKEPALAEQFAISSAFSPWSEEIQTLSTLNFWIAGNPRNADSNLRIQVFRWQEGEAKTKTFEVGAGDQIGSADGAVDYSTQWTLVDLRQDARGDWFAMLMDPQGDVRRREVNSDLNDPNFRKMKEQAAAAAAAAAAAVPGAAPATPPRPGGMGY